MRDLGLTVVRVGEFAWDKFEPAPQQIDFSWLDDAIDILANEGLQIVMCTPTATPPPWLLQQHPEILRVREDGVRISPGGRRHACASVDAYREHSQRITEAITQHYADHPAVIGWQIDNEFGCGETVRCYCDFCRRNFHQWLQQHYGSLDALNAAWGTQFWGMRYTDWAQIPIPGVVTEPQNPGMRLDYRRFSSDNWVDFQRMQVEILRRNAPDHWITHNFMIKFWSLDYWKLAQDLDFVSYDNYPHQARGAAEVAMNLDLMRSFKRRNFWIMEQQPGRVNWHPYNPPVPAGQVRSWSHQAIAHGADAVVYFRYRSACTGQEQYHAGLLKWNADKDQCYFEAESVNQVIKDLPEFTTPQAKVGIIFDYDDLWAIELEPHTRDFSYWNLVYEIYEHYWDADIPVDFLPRDADLTGYETVILPAGFLMRDTSHWREWVEQGGQLIITCRTGYREPSNIATDRDLPGGLTDLIGAKVVEFASVPPDDFIPWPEHRTGTGIRGNQTLSEAYKIWAEALEPTSADPLFTYEGGMFAGKAAITQNKIGSGSVLYIGCWLKHFDAVLGRYPTTTLKSRQLIDENGETWHVTYNPSALPVDDTPSGMSFGVDYIHA
jgi:beta-galactosidase